MAVNPHQSWFDVDGDNTLALDWVLSENSHVWEIGGFEGRWAQQIWDKFHCNITIFEPQLWAVERMLKRFRGNEKIDIRPYGLWIQDDILPVGNYYTDGASIMTNDGREDTQLGAFRSIKKEVETDVELYESLIPLDLALMNIEGAEYVLLPHMINNRLMGAFFYYFWCQFHPDNENDTRHLEIFKGMERTHDMIWNHFPTAVAWRRKE